MSLGERRADVRGHVVGALERVPVLRIAFRRDALEVIGEVRSDVRVVVFLNQQRRRSVLQEDRQQADAEFRPCEPLRDRIGEDVQAFASCSNIEAVLVMLFRRTTPL